MKFAAALAAVSAFAFGADAQGLRIDQLPPAASFGDSGLFPAWTPDGHTARVTGALAARHVATNAALTATSTAMAPALVRDSIATPGDAPPLQFYASASGCSLNAGAGDVGTQVPSADGKCWLANNGQTLDPREFGAKCDGTTDDTTALTAWAARAAIGVRLYIPSNGNPSSNGCAFASAPIVFATARNVTLSGDGRSSRLVYIGASTTSDLLVIGATGTGNGCTGASGWTIKDFRLISNTVMTAGDGIHAHDLCDSTISNAMLGGEWGGGNQNLWNAIELDGFNSVYTHQNIISAQQNGVLAHGVTESATHIPGIDLYVSQTKIDHTGVAFHIAGGVGGFTLDSGDILENGRHLLIDQSVDANPNAQFFIGLGAALDVAGDTYVPATSGYKGNANNGIGIDVEDAGQATNQSILQMSGTWLASAGQGTPQACLYLAPAANNWDVSIAGGRIYNCQGDGVKIASSGAIVHISGARIGQNGGYGINNVGGSKVTAQAVVFAPVNTGGDTNGVVNLASFDRNQNGYLSANGYLQFQSSAGNITLNAGSGQTVVACGGSGAGTYGLWARANVIAPGKCDASATIDNAVTLGSSTAAWSTVYAYLLQSRALTIATLPTCGAANVGAMALVNNGAASPTYRQAVSTTGGATEPVFCVYNGASYGWAY